MLCKLIAAAGVALFSIASAQAEPDFATLDARLSEIVDAEGVVGASVAVTTADGVVFAQGYGQVDREAGSPATAATPFRAGSISKLVTAAAAMRLVEAGRLDLNTPLAEAAPAVQFTNRFEETAPVRLVHLLEHTAGWDDIQLQEYRSFPGGTSIEDGLADNPRSRTSRYAPGLYHSYANSGPAVIGQVIETATRLDFDSAARALIFEPLGLASASFDQDAAERRIPSYDRDGEPGAFTRIWAAPSGGLSIAAEDLAALGRLLLNDGDGFLSAASVRRMEQSLTSRAGQAGLPPYGLGLYASRDKTGLWLGHAGAIDFAQAELFFNRKTGFTYALMVNTVGPAMGEMRTAIRAALAQAPVPEPQIDTGWRLPDGAAGTYRIINPRQEMVRALIDLFEPVTVSECEEAVCIARGLGAAAERYEPMGEGLHFNAGAAHERIALIETGPGRFELSYGDGETFVPTSALRLTAPVALWVMTLLALAAALITLLVWSAARPFGVFAGQNRWRVWLWPSLSALLLGVGLGTFVSLSSGDVLANFAGPSLGGRLIQLGTFAFGPLALAGVWFAFRAQAVRLFARIQAGATSALLALTWVWMAVYGWAGLTPWSYAPGTFG